MNPPNNRLVRRILQVSTADVAGGAESSAYNLHISYRTHGLTSWLAVGRQFGSKSDVLLIPNEIYRSAWVRWWRQLSANYLLSGLVYRYSKLSYLSKGMKAIAEPHRVLIWLMGREDFEYPGSRRLFDILPELPDIIHCHNLHGDYFDLRLLPWISDRMPLVLDLRDAWLLTGHCAHSFECDRWHTGCGQCPYLGTYPAVHRDATAYNWRYKQAIYARSRLYVVTASQWLMDRVEISMLPAIQRRVIPNAINLSVFRPGDRQAARHALGLPSHADIVLLTSHNEFKDYSTMEQALGYLQNERGADLLFICLGGTGEDRQLGQGRLIPVEVQRDPARLALYYQSADVFIHAARAETFGKMVTEAMACGIPVIATAVGGIPEQIVNSYTGLLTPPKDPHAMAIAIGLLLNDSNWRFTMGQAAAEHARQYYGLDRQVEAFLNFYEEVREDWIISIAKSSHNNS